MARIETKKTARGEKGWIRRIRQALAKEHVEEARRLVAQAVQEFPGSEGLQKLHRVLQPPRVIGALPPGKSRDREREWLKENAKNYPGMWVAICDNHLVAADRDLKKVVEAIRTQRQFEIQDILLTRLSG